MINLPREGHTAFSQTLGLKDVGNADVLGDKVRVPRLQCKQRGLLVMME